MVQKSWTGREIRIFAGKSYIVESNCILIFQLNKITNMTPTTKEDPWWNAFSTVLEEMNCNISKEIFVGATDSRYLREVGFFRQVQFNSFYLAWLQSDWFFSNDWNSSTVA